MLKDALEKIIAGEVLDDEKSKEFYGRDASLFYVRPEVVVAPKDSEDVKNLVKFVSAEKMKGRKISLTARSGGTDMSGGAIGESIVVDFTKHMNRLLEINKEYAVVEPGMFYRDFEKEADKLGVMMPSYPASKGICAIGGIIANNSGGEKTLAYGKTENYVEELKVVMADGEEHTIRPVPTHNLEQKMAERNFEGELYTKFHNLIQGNLAAIKAAKPQVNKNSAGYYLWNIWGQEYFDLNKLLVGSQGTLGLVTQVKLKLVPKKKYSRLAVIFLTELASLPELVKMVLKYKPESFECYDDKTLKFEMKFIPALLKSLKFRAIVLGWRFLPELFMFLSGGIPRLILLAEITGDDEKEIIKKLELLRAEVIKKFQIKVRLTKSAAESEKYWILRRESFNLLRKHVKNRQTAPFIDDIIVRPEFLPEFLPKLSEIIESYGDKMISTLQGHVGDGNFHVIPLMDLTDPSAVSIIPEVSEKVYDLVLKYHGSITAEHNDGLIRSPYLIKMYGEKIVKLFEETKNIFDPLNIFNPGKKVYSNLNYALAHIKAKPK